MSVVEWPHLVSSIDDWTELPETQEFHVEVVEGVLLVSPRGSSFHQLAAIRLAYWLDVQILDGFSALTQVEVVLAESPLTVRVPDVTVTSADVQPDLARLGAGTVKLVIEVLSEDSRRTDRVTKLSEYANAGIEHYWMVDLEPPITMIACRLVGNNYKTIGEFSGIAEVEFAGRPLTLDLDALTSRYAQRP